MKANPKHLARASAIAALALLAVLILAACGSSSPSSTTSAKTSSTSSTAQGPGGAFATRFKALRECLKKEGIELPQRSPGSGKRPKPGGAIPFGSGAPSRRLPNGVSRSKYEAAVKKCGGTGFRRGSFSGRVSSPAFKKSLEKFASCMRSNGVNVPAPNTSGKGPVFNTKGINTASSKFKAAESKCSSLLGFARGGNGAPPGGGAPQGTPPAGEPPAGG